MLECEDWTGSGGKGTGQWKAAQTRGQGSSLEGAAAAREERGGLKAAMGGQGGQAMGALGRDRERDLRSTEA